jgi:hypothetical protein
VPKARPVVPCVFCGLSRLASVEDVVPKWVRYALDPASNITVRAEPDGATARMQHLVVTLHDMVCEECNTGWMLRLVPGLQHQFRPCRSSVATGIRHRSAMAVQPGPDAHLAREAATRALAAQSSRRPRGCSAKPSTGAKPLPTGARKETPHAPLLACRRVRTSVQMTSETDRQPPRAGFPPCTGNRATCSPPSRRP